MSIWTSDPAISARGLLALGLLLAGCGGGLPRGGDFGPLPQVDSEIAVTPDRVMVTGPEGFCIDPSATRDRGQTAFVLLGNCAAIGNSARLPQPQTPAVLTAAISEPGPAGSLASNIPAMAAFFTSAEGRGMLSRDQNPASVEILNMFHQGDVFFLHARDVSAATIQGMRPEYWRAYMDVGPRIATLSVLSPNDQASDDNANLQVLHQFASAVAAANSNSSLASLESDLIRDLGAVPASDAVPQSQPDGPYDRGQGRAQSGDGGGRNADEAPRRSTPRITTRGVVRTLDAVGVLRRLFN